MTLTWHNALDPVSRPCVYVEVATTGQPTGISAVAICRHRAMATRRRREYRVGPDTRCGDHATPTPSRRSPVISRMAGRGIFVPFPREHTRKQTEKKNGAIAGKPEPPRPQRSREPLDRPRPRQRSNARVTSGTKHSSHTDRHKSTVSCRPRRQAAPPGRLQCRLQCRPRRPRQVRCRPALPSPASHPHELSTEDVHSLRSCPQPDVTTT
jgi:hypothetical protein